MLWTTLALELSTAVHKSGCSAEAAARLRGLKQAVECCLRYMLLGGAPASQLAAYHWYACACVCLKHALA